MKKLKADIKHRVNINNHIELGKVVPLEAPFVLLIDPSNLCNFRCNFCPTGHKDLIRKTGRYQGNLNFDLYKKIIDDLSEYSEPIKVLRLYKEGEPLVNPHFPEMIKYARDSKKVSRIDTTTNGALLNPLLNKKIIESGLDQINISVNGINAEQIFRYTNSKISFEKYVKNIKDLYDNRGNCEISIKAIKENLTNDEQKIFFDIFGNISTRIFLESLSPAWPDFKYTEDESLIKNGNYGQPIIEKDICPYIFYIMVINSDGKSSFCVGDWKHILIAGDLKKESVKNIWQGQVLNSARLAHVEGRRFENDFCRVCQVVSHGTLDNLDPFKKEIRDRLLQ